jgi:phosphopantothenoylcysteine decarboxylase/phosphopantothenate--cysteine ligase
MPNPQIIVAVTGGVAAYKTAALTSQLVQSGHTVRVVMTSAAEKFVGRATFAALTGQPVAVDLFDPSFPLGAHIEMARDSRLMCIAPATANFLANAASGRADDLISTLYLCFTGIVLAAPAMNCEMWEKPAVQRNVQTLRDDGVQFVDPSAGWLSCRTKGVGRMAEPTDIFDAIHTSLNRS